LFLTVRSKQGPAPPRGQLRPKRLPLLHLRELLASLAHFGDVDGTCSRLRGDLDRIMGHQ
ncbi:hypothetical protein ACWGHA_40430, partial [Streptomyces xanthophaeus]